MKLLDRGRPDRKAISSLVERQGVVDQCCIHYIGKKMKNRRTASGAILFLVTMPLVHSGSWAQSHTRTDQISYNDNVQHWVVGQVQSIKCVAPTISLPHGCGTNGVELSKVTFDSLARPTTISEFGKDTQILTYNTNGTLATITDGNGEVTSFNSWKRGIPQEVVYPDGTKQLSEVDDNGWVRSITDEVGSKTCYGYDVMGRVNLVLYPREGEAPGICDDSSWEKTTIEYRPLTAGEWRPPGVDASQWREYTATGNYQKLVYFDALWRPVLVHEYDASRTTETLRATSTAYNVNGRVAFQSYPSVDIIPAASGTWTFYDSIGRIVEVRKDSEHGQLISRTEYAGLKRLVTGPDNERTTTTYQAFDQPSYEVPILVEEPLGRTTRITRDIFGKPIEIERGQ